MSVQSIAITSNLKLILFASGSAFSCSVMSPGLMDGDDGSRFVSST